ncbi:stage V sporulation protein E [bacterium (Candidatus Gribaldobacteria) CG08_land_8_20_14_0_20_39_15]|uniref:Probable peptidoglycan glycosyltransferase FtsW n=1 Tax=bacterium (Candidatus Gribaldobacteria) CG08_land_8_20_14_0_20_39_15 TaxID=2014273 RepID=A0A2M6XUD2_9BACT|nr:MAG: stage V sporulation protein E [bacterium (Candidatus Gribaldobacteria) CG08_land_8_20_14_0_20_39_15]
MAGKKLFKKKRPPDYFLLAVIVVLTLWGLFAMGLISLPLSQQRFGTPWHYLQNQLIKLAVGIFLGVVLYKLPIKFLKKTAPLIFFVTLLLTLLVFVPGLGVKIGGGQRWISVAGFLFQPSEFLKIVFIIYLAAWLDKSKAMSDKKKFKEIFLPFFTVAIIIFAVLALQPDLSTLCILLAVCLMMYFTASTPLKHTVSLIGAGMAGLIALVLIKPHALNRWLIFLHPETDPLGKGFQLRQSLLAVGSGKIFGIKEGFGFGLGEPNIGLLPTPITDSIFAIIGKGWGFIGASAVVILFFLLFWRILKNSKTQGQNFEGLLSLGIGVWIIFQTFFNITGMLGLMPMGGVPLPFFSYGGSHLIAEMMAVGILLNLSKSK